MNKYYLSVPFNDKYQVRLRGGQWDPIVHKWYYTFEEEKVKFLPWLIEEKTKEYTELSNEQKYFIDTALKGDNILVDACIGSGKTTAIQCLCTLLKHKTVLYLTYNTLLKIDAKNKIILPNITVTNYHGFSVSILKKYNIAHTPNKAIQILLEHKPLLPIYDVVIIDEYQDIEQEFAELLEYIKSFNPNIQLIAVGDMSQKIYDKTRLRVQQFINKFLGNYELIYFTKCFRLNKDYANYLGSIWHKQINGVNENCTVETMDFNKVVNFLLQQEPKDIICLGSRYKTMALLLNQLETKAPQKFNKKTVYATIDDVDKDTITPDAKTAIFTSYDSSKGMERKICVICDFTKKYWTTRTNQPMTNYNIIRNIFLVAASRGKERIIFVNPIDKDVDTLLDKLTLETPTIFNTNINYPFNVSDMFGFKYVEDVMKCYKLLNIQKIQESDDIIDINNKDELIDISPAIGIYCQACFFKNYNIDTVIQKMNEEHRAYIYGYQNKSLQYKILCIVASNTHYQRYKHQVNTPYVNEEQTNLIKQRLSKVFNENEIVEQFYSLPFKGVNKKWKITGRCDVLKNSIPYELKFVTELAPEHYLQAALYSVMSKSKYAILFNVKNNEMYKVSVNNKQVFLNNVINCITKGIITSYKDVK